MNVGIIHRYFLHFEKYYISVDKKYYLIKNELLGKRGENNYLGII
jgi:hypothetical protein